jgi:simple sugar transport system ATP-binding protein
MKVLSGYIKADSGSIFLDGRQVVIRSPSDAVKLGIGMLHQDPLDFPPMKVIDNFITGSPIESDFRSFFPDYRKAKSEFLELMNRFNFKLEPDSYVDRLTVGERQQLEILRLLWRGVQILVLDEPTTGISLPQKVLLFETLKQLAAEGKTILFVSHKLEDVNELCDGVSVLRQGKLVGQSRYPFNMNELVNLMFGKQIEKNKRQSFSTNENNFILSGIFYEDHRNKLENFSIEIKHGEIIGIAGMEGSGQQEFLRVCSGLLRPSSGRILFKNKNLFGKDYQAFHKLGVTYLPASRLEEGLISGLSIMEHFLLSEEDPGIFLNPLKAYTTTLAEINNFRIRGNPHSLVETLSGGNQQRTLLALMRQNTQMIFMEHPTRGLDVESANYIWSKLKERCKNGASIMFISSDLEEILDNSDRILVFFSGRISKPILAEYTNSEVLGQLIGGKGWQELQ